jgi:pimeloyl-ACP methyl ester carboxylesterase
VSLVAASQSRAISFVIDHSGMLLPAWQQELYRLSSEARADGVNEEDIAKAVEFEARLMTVAAKGQGWPEIAETMRANEKASWMELVYKPASLDELQRVWRNDFSFDPRPFAGRVNQPVLGLFGGLDKSTPIESAANLANAVSDREMLTIEFFPTANHAFLEAKTGGNGEIATLSHFAPGMFASMHRWLRARARARQSIGEGS